MTSMVKSRGSSDARQSFHRSGVDTVVLGVLPGPSTHSPELFRAMFWRK